MNDFVYSPENAQIGFGTKSLRLLEILVPFVEQANVCKYDFIDCAWRYGNEAIIGLALKEIQKSQPDFNLAISFQSKVWPSQFVGGIAKSLKFTLAKIRAINSIEQYMLHRPSQTLDLNVSAWKQLLDCKRNRLAKKIGLGHFDKDTIVFLHSITGVYPDFVQYELSVNNMRYDRIKFCENNNIAIQATEPFGQLDKNLQEPLLINLAEKYKTNIKAILIAFLLNQNIVPIVVPTSIEEISELIKAKKIVLTKDEIDSLRCLNSYETKQFEGIEIELK